MIQQFGQIIIGYPGAGKTTFCYTFSKFLSSSFKNPILINFDPGNDTYEFFFEINICKLIFVPEISSELHLGPNGAILYAMEYFEKNFDWVERGLNKIIKVPSEYNFIFDFPGQIELYTHHSIIRKIVKKIQSNRINLTTISLIDSIYWKDRGTLFFVFLISILIMFNIEIPFFNVLTKIDLIIPKNENKSFNLTQIQKYGTRNIFLHSSIFFWANKLYKLINEIILEFSPCSMIPINSFEKKYLKYIFSKIKELQNF